MTAFWPQGLGAAAARLIADKEYGYMVAVKNNEITKVPLSEVAGKVKRQWIRNVP